jgi:hypothetical protein
MNKNGVETGTRVSGSLIFCVVNGEREEERKGDKGDRDRKEERERKIEKERGRKGHIDGVK